MMRDEAVKVSSVRGRSTFLEIREIVDHAQRYMMLARERLVDGMRADSASERARIFLSVIERRRVALEETIRAAAEQADAGVMNTRVQYTPDWWSVDPSPSSRLGVDEAITWILEHDGRISDSFELVASRTDSLVVEHFASNLAELVRSHDRQLARDLHGLRDL